MWYQEKKPIISKLSATEIFATHPPTLLYAISIQKELWAIMDGSFNLLTNWTKWTYLIRLLNQWMTSSNFGLIRILGTSDPINSTGYMMVSETFRLACQCSNKAGLSTSLTQTSHQQPINRIELKYTHLPTVRRTFLIIYQLALF